MTRAQQLARLALWEAAASLLVVLAALGMVAVRGGPLAPLGDLILNPGFRLAAWLTGHLEPTLIVPLALLLSFCLFFGLAVGITAFVLWFRVASQGEPPPKIT